MRVARVSTPLHPLGGLLPSACVFDRCCNRIAHGIRELRHGSRLRCYPTTPPVSGFIERGQAGSSQQIVGHGCCKRIPGSDWIGNLNLQTGMVVPLFAVDEQAAAAATSNGDERERGKLGEKPPGASSLKLRI